MLLHKILKLTGAAFAVAAITISCAKLSEALSDAENKLVLQDVSFDDTDGAEGAEASPSPAPDEQERRGRRQCRRNPLLDACKDDAKTYCEQYLPPPPGERKQCGQESFEDRRAKVQALVDCLQTNVATLSEACQKAVEGIPPQPPTGEAGEGREFADRPEHRRPHRKPERGCGGESVLRDCVSDVQSLCPQEIPSENEVDNFSEEHRRLNVRAIVECLNGQLSSVSDACKASLEKLPEKKN